MYFTPSKPSHELPSVITNARPILGDLDGSNCHVSDEDFETCEKNFLGKQNNYQAQHKYDGNNAREIPYNVKNTNFLPQIQNQQYSHLQQIQPQVNNFYGNTGVNSHIPTAQFSNTSSYAAGDNTQGQFNGTNAQQFQNTGLQIGYKNENLYSTFNQQQPQQGNQQHQIIEQPSQQYYNQPQQPLFQDSYNYSEQNTFKYKEMTTPLQQKNQSYQDQVNQILSTRDQNTYLSNRVNQAIIGAQEFKDSQQKSRQLSPKHQEELFQRLNNEAKLQQESKHLLTLQQERKVMEQCTFAPNLSEKSIYQQDNSQYSRSLEQFLADQEKFQKNQAEKIRYLKHQAEEAKMEAASHQPKIDPKSEILAQRNRDANESVHDRLYKTPSKSFSQHNESTFQPSINEKSKMLTRKGNVDEHLYADAMRRLESQKCNTTMMDKLTEKSSSVQNTTINANVDPKKSKTEEMVASKFVKEFEKVCDEVTFNQMSLQVDYMQTGEILTKLHFLVGGEGFGKERKLLSDLWWHLRGDENQHITKCNLCEFLLQILGIFGFQLRIPLEKKGNARIDVHNSQDEEDFVEGQNSKIQFKRKQFKESILDSNLNQEITDISILNNNARKGYLDTNNNWVVSYEEGKIIQKQFECMLLNRMSGEQRKNEVADHSNSNQGCQFQPQILESSKRLAEQYRGKLLEETAALIDNEEIKVRVPENGKITHIDLLMFQKQAQINERNKKIIEQQNYLGPECTFHPQTLQSQASRTSGVQKSNQLYALAKHNQKNIRLDKNKNDLEYERDADQCTFKPDTKLSKPTIKSQNNTILNITSVSVSAQEKAIQRMRAANKQREEKNVLLSRGYKKPDASQSSSSKKEQKIYSTPSQSTKNAYTRQSNDLIIQKQAQQSYLTNQGTYDLPTQKQVQQTYNINQGTYDQPTQKQAQQIYNTNQGIFENELRQNQQDNQEIQKQKVKSLDQFQQIEQQQEEAYRKQLEQDSLQYSQSFQISTLTNNSLMQQQQQSTLFSNSSLLQQQLQASNLTNKSQLQQQQMQQIQPFQPQQYAQQQQDYTNLREKEQQQSISEEEQQSFEENEQKTSQQQQPSYEQEKYDSKQRSQMQTKLSYTAVSQSHPLERVPLLFVDVNLGVRSERIVIFEGDDTGQLAHEFASSHQLDSVMESKLKDLLDNQLASLLLKIEEEGEDYHADNE